MQLMYTLNRVKANIEISKDIFRLIVTGEFEVKPGQFFMIRSWGREPFLARPISVHDADKESISFLYQAKGEGTKYLSRLVENDEVELLGPLGNGFDIDAFSGKIAVVAGGIGIAPMKYLIKSLKDCRVDLYAGFREEAYILDEVGEYVDKVFAALENGTSGHKGYVTEIFDPHGYDAVLCCGPEVMMKKVVEMCGEAGTPVYISMEKHMACGIGACLVCTCKTKEGNKRTCKDGPVFSGKDVIFDA